MNIAQKCGYCGFNHANVCPLIKAIEYHPDGMVKRVEFKTAADYPQGLSIETDWASYLRWPARAGDR